MRIFTSSGCWLLAAGLALAGMAGTASAQAPQGRYRDALDVVLAKPNPLPPMIVPAFSETDTREDITQRAMGYFISGDFASLEAMAAAYRTPVGARTPSGAWKLDIFYDAFSSCPCRHGVEMAKRFRQQSAAYLAAYPNSPTPVLIETLSRLGEAEYILLANHAASQEEVFEAFMARVSEAQDFLLANRERALGDPHGYALFAQIGSINDANDRDYADFLRAAMKKAPLYTPLYYRAVRFYMPRWRDEPARIETIARQALEASREIEGQAMYARVYMHAYLRGYGPDLYNESDIDRTLFRASVVDLITRYPDRHNFENFAQLACENRDTDLSRLLIDRLQALPSESYAWEGETPYQGCRSWLYSQTAAPARR